MGALSVLISPAVMGLEIKYPGPERESVVFARAEVEGRGFRIPATVQTKSGRLLAFCEQRVGLHDHAQNDMVMKSSEDDGKTWSKLLIVADEGGDSLNDPRAVVLESGRVLFLYKRYPKGFHARNSKHTKMADLGYGGARNVRSYIMHSEDNGKTWSKPRELTRSIRAQDAISVGSPGVGIQLKRGEHKGRVVFACYETIPPGDGKRIWTTRAMFSDDQGETWALGRRVSEAGLGGYGNEAQVVELPDGSVLFSARNQGGTKRKLAVSQDGGETWTNYRLADELVSPACMASVIRYSEPSEGSKGSLLHSLPFGKGRKNGMIFSSLDDGASWKAVAQVQPSGFAYSCLVKLKSGAVGCLYEGTGYKEIRFAVFPAPLFSSGGKQ